MRKNDCVVAVVEMNKHFALVRGEDGKWDFPMRELSKGETIGSGKIAMDIAFDKASLVTTNAAYLGVRDAGEGNLAAYYLLDGVDSSEILHRSTVRWATAEEVMSTAHRFDPLWKYMGPKAA